MPPIHSAEDPYKNATRTADRNARLAKNRQQARAAQTAGRAKRSI